MCTDTLIFLSQLHDYTDFHFLPENSRYTECPVISSILKLGNFSIKSFNLCCKVHVTKVTLD